MRFGAMRFSWRALPLSFSNLIALSGMVLTGCASKPAPVLPRPAAQMSVELYSGSPLSGPSARVAEASHHAEALLVSVRIVALEKPTHLEQLDSIGPQTRLISSSNGDLPVLATSNLTQSCRFAAGGRALAVQSSLDSGALGRHVEMSSQTVCVPAGATVTLSAVDQQPDSTSNRRGVQIAMYLPLPTASDSGTMLDLAIGVEDSYKPVAANSSPEDSKDEHAAAVPDQHARELAVLAPIAIDGPTGIALLIPFQYSDRKTQAILVLLNAATATDSPEDQALVAQAADALAKSSAVAASQPSSQPSGIAQWPGFSVALAGLSHAASRRSCLAYLSTQTGAAICEDLIMVADDATLQQLGNLIATQTSATNQPHDAATLSWLLDLSALRLLTQRQTANDLSPELTSVLIRQTGQSGQNPGAVQELVSVSTGRRDFETRLRAENLLFLEDTSPSARVRAFDWLNARGEAPAGFDPLGSVRDRREALERSWSAMTAQPSSANAGGKP